MDITPLVTPGLQIIQSYGQWQFRISGAVYDGAVIVTAEAVSPWRFTGLVETMTGEDCAQLLALAGRTDVLLIGTGATGRRAGAATRAMLKDAGLNVDFMDTGAACRTYNVLVAEGRHVAAALSPV